MSFLESLSIVPVLDLSGTVRDKQRLFRGLTAA